jgi:rubrerythrin
VRVFVAAIVAVEQRHRDIVRTWFEELCHGTRGVSHLM